MGEVRLMGREAWEEKETGGGKREKGGIRQLGKGTRRRKAQRDAFMTGNTQDILCEREPVNSLL